MLPDGDIGRDWRVMMIFGLMLTGWFLMLAYALGAT